MSKKINVISRCVKPYDSFDEYIKLAENPDFRFVISNTQPKREYAFSEDDKISGRPADTFPAKAYAAAA